MLTENWSVDIILDVVGDVELVEPRLAEVVDSEIGVRPGSFRTLYCSSLRPLTPKMSMYPS